MRSRQGGGERGGHVLHVLGCIRRMHSVQLQGGGQGWGQGAEHRCTGGAGGRGGQVGSEHHLQKGGWLRGGIANVGEGRAQMEHSHDLQGRGVKTRDFILSKTTIIPKTIML